MKRILVPFVLALGLVAGAVSFATAGSTRVTSCCPGCQHCPDPDHCPWKK